MVKSVDRMVLAFLALALTLHAVPAGAEESAQRRSMRQLAAELAERLGEERIELRAHNQPVEIEAIGIRESEEPALFKTRIPSHALIVAMNRERESRGLAPLKRSRRLSLAAGDRLAEMMEEGYFAHVSPTGREPFDAIQERGYDFSDAGENLAAGFASARSVVSAWMKSPGHRENLLSPDFEEVGVAICADAPTDAMRGHTFVALYGAK